MKIILFIGFAVKAIDSFSSAELDQFCVAPVLSYSIRKRGQMCSANDDECRACGLGELTLFILVK